MILEEEKARRFRREQVKNSWLYGCGRGSLFCSWFFGRKAKVTISRNVSYLLYVNSTFLGGVLLMVNTSLERPF